MRIRMGFTFKEAELEPLLSSLERNASGVHHSGLLVTVVFTTLDGTAAALKTAAKLAAHLDARIQLVAVQVVPYPLRLDRPPVPVAFLKQQLRTLASAVDGKTDSLVVLCRDKWECLAGVLKPGSLVVLGGKSTWWPTEEKRLGRLLSKRGHDVVLAPLPRG